MHTLSDINVGVIAADRFPGNLRDVTDKVPCRGLCGSDS